LIYFYTKKGWGDDSMDEAVIMIVKKTSPLPHHPPGLFRLFLDMTLIFTPRDLY
jgi:hypothetical protein